MGPIRGADNPFHGHWGTVPANAGVVRPLRVAVFLYENYLTGGSRPLAEIWDD